MRKRIVPKKSEILFAKTIFIVSLHRQKTNAYCGNSSVGRAQPCQGWGREFESRFPLEIPMKIVGIFCQDALVVELVDTRDLKSRGQ